MKRLTPRLLEIVEALSVYPGIRMLEIGCGPGAAAREIAHRIGDGHILAIDRSAKAIEQAMRASQKEIRSGKLSFRQVAIEDFELSPDELSFDIAFAVRVGALDGRHSKVGELALLKIAKALKPDGKLFIDGGDPLREISLEKYR